VQNTVFSEAVYYVAIVVWITVEVAFPHISEWKNGENIFV
jgi:hypothetical protein